MANSTQLVQAFPKVTVGCGRAVEFLGYYNASGRFKAVSRFTRRSSVPDAGLDGSTNVADKGLRPLEVPDFVNLHPSEHPVENFMPPARAMQPVKGQRLLGSLRDDLVTLVYGREKMLVAPQYLTKDSRGRLIVSDPGAAAVHVLDGKQSFRIVGGPGRRLRSPSGVAVDADDNIYVADTDRGLVEVYAPDGGFLHEMGSLTKDEGLFEHPTAISIDGKNGHIYVLDSSRNLLYMLDLQGKVLKRVGTARRNSSGLMLRGRGQSGQTPRDATTSVAIDFDRPTAISVTENEVLILDAGGSRVQVTDLQCNFLRQLNIQEANNRGIAVEMGLATDVEGNIYVSNLNRGSVTVYNHDGQALSSFGRMGNRLGEFNTPAALWIDSTNAIYVADASNRRIQVFRITSHN